MAATFPDSAAHSDNLTTASELTATDISAAGSKVTSRLVSSASSSAAATPTEEVGFQSELSAAAIRAASSKVTSSLVSSASSGAVTEEVDSQVQDASVIGSPQTAHSDTASETTDAEVPRVQSTAVGQDSQADSGGQHGESVREAGSPVHGRSDDEWAWPGASAAAAAVAEQVEADAALARRLQYELDLSDEDAEGAAASSAATESGVQRSVTSSQPALQAESARGRAALTAPTGRSNSSGSSSSNSSSSSSILSRPELPAIRTSLQLQPSSQHLDAEPARTEEEQVAQALAQSLAESVACSGTYPAEAAVGFVGGRMPLAALAETFRDSPTVGGNLGRLLGKFSYVRYIKGEVAVSSYAVQPKPACKHNHGHSGSAVMVLGFVGS